MKTKLLSQICILMILVSTISGRAFAKGDFPLYYGQIRVLIDGTEMVFPDAQAFISDEGRTMIPVRAVSEALNAKVDWNDILKIVTVTKDDIEAKFKIGYTKNDLSVKCITNARYKEIQLDSPPVILYDRTYVPLRFICEAFGYSVDWNDEDFCASIDTAGKNEVFLKNPALSEGSYVIEDELPQYQIVSEDFNSGEIDSSMKENLYERAKKHIESVGNIVYSKITAEEAVYGVAYEVYRSIPAAYYQNFYSMRSSIFKEAIENRVIREIEFESAPDKIKVDASGKFIRSAYVTGKLKFIYRKPTKDEYLNGFKESVEAGRWYETDVTVALKRQNVLGLVVDYVVLGNTWKEAQAE